MGFDENLCKHAAINTNENAELAVGWIMENMENPVYMVPPERTPNDTKAPADGGGNEKMKVEVEKLMADNDGEGKYKLRAFVSHIGSNTGSGHYVCHIYDDDRKLWAIYNDEKVAVSEDVPLKHGYLYFYQRV